MTQFSNKFAIQPDHKHIAIWTWVDYKEIHSWAEQYPTMYTVYFTGINYTDETALTFFLLRWS